MYSFLSTMTWIFVMIEICMEIGAMIFILSMGVMMIFDKFINKRKNNNKK